MVKREHPLKVALVVAPQVSLLTYVLAYEPLHAANRLSYEPPFDIRILTVEAQELVASNGMPIAHDGVIDDVSRFDLVIVVASFEPDDSYKRRLNSWLRRQSRYGAMLCALDHAVWLFAEAGLYPEQTQISANREILGAMQEKFPRLDVQGTLYSISRNRMTCGGHTATLDMFLDFISQTCGEGLVQVLLSEMLYSSIRQGDTLQSDSLSAGNWKMHPMLNRALNVMVTNIERPLSLREVARRAGISLRQLEQLARNSNALMPSRQYLEVRLAHARETLIYTDMTISEIALATGFSALSAFSRAFGARFQSSPRDYRNRFRKRMMRPFIR